MSKVLNLSKLAIGTLISRADDKDLEADPKRVFCISEPGFQPRWITSEDIECHAKAPSNCGP